MATVTETDPSTGSEARAKPPFLRRVRIRNYKSIAFCDVALEPLTILVGRNGSGKSNFLDGTGVRTGCDALLFAKDRAAARRLVGTTLSNHS